MPSRDAFLPLVKRYCEQDPAGAAQTLEALSEDKAAIALSALPSGVASNVFALVQPATAGRLIQHLPPASLAEIVKRLDPQQATSIFIGLGSEDRERFVASLQPEVRDRMRELLTFPEGSAGRIMKADFLSFREDETVRDAIQKLRAQAKKHAAGSYLYVVNANRELTGVLYMRDMILATPDTRLDAVMKREVFAVDAFTDREQVAAELQRHKFFAVPVTDAQRRLLGVVKAEQIIEGVQEEATEDIQKMFGAGGDERAFSTMRFSLKKRLPWLHVNLATAFLAAGVVSLFEEMIAKLTVLAVFLPVVAGQGGNAGGQTLAVVMRGLVMREIPADRVRALVAKESAVGAVNGLTIGVITAAVAWFWNGNPYLGLVVGLGMLVNLTVAGFAGAAIPLAMKSIGLDPAQCSNIILTTVTDVMGFFSFLGFAVLFQDLLIGP